MDEEVKRRLIKKRAIIKAGCTRIETFVNSGINEAESCLVQVKLERLLAYREDFHTVQAELEFNDEENSEEHITYREEFEDICDVLESKLRKALSSQSAQNISVNRDKSVSENSLNAARHIKLPRINLPTFSGELISWLNFKDTFDNLILHNDGLSDIEKFHYLLSSLKGEAKDTIKNIKVSETNFSVAYNLLKNRYHLPKLIGAEYVRLILQEYTKPCSTEQELRQLINAFQGNLDSLKALDAPISILDMLLSELMLKQVDKSIRLEFEKKFAHSDAVEFKDLVQFLEKRCQTLQMCATKSNTKYNQTIQNKTPNKMMRQSYIATSDQCILCNGRHVLYKCPAFLSAKTSDRFRIVKRNKLCSNCLSSSHIWKHCTSKMTCRECNNYHHTLLHDDSKVTSDQQQSVHVTAVERNSTPSTYYSLRSQPEVQVLLSTACIRIKDTHGKLHVFRAILDNGSQSNFISEQVVQQLKLKKKRSPITLQAFGDLTSRAETAVNIDVYSMFSDYHFNIDCIVLPKITGKLPVSRIQCQSWNIPQDLLLADPNFNIPQATHLLIGAQVFMRLLKMEQLTRKGMYPVLQNTHLGWIVSGQYTQPCSEDKSLHSSTQALFLRSDFSLEAQLQRFWSLEEVKQVAFSREQKECEEHFKKTTKRDATGRFIVELPLKEDHELGCSRDMAIQRFHQLESKLQWNSTLRKDYISFMDEYENLGHMKAIPDNTVEENVNYYMPHHAVLKPTSTTTKTRVVFDASAKTSNGRALNDVLKTGPNIQDDLCSIVMRFRIHQIAFTADIEKMYRQVKINENNYNLQRILWRKHPKAELKTFVLTTVTYGTSSASFLATRCLQELAFQNQHTLPKASNILLNDFYMDDCMSGTATLEEAIAVREDLQELLKSGGFVLRKWCTNSTELLDSIPSYLRETQHDLVDGSSDIVRTLGLIWRPSSDEFHISCALKSVKSLQTHAVTKRQILSVISSIFDPLGLLSPVVVLCKIFMQKLWQERSSWDETLPTNLIQEWHSLESQISLLNSITIPRLVLSKGVIANVQLHGFCDASEKAYGACIYLRSTNTNGTITVKLLCSRSRVAPLKQISLPRLELCGALLLSRLAKKVQDSLRLKLSEFHLWTDSTIVLAWLNSCPTKWKTFTANRVAEIQENAPVNNWHHVSSQDNPADLVSRGTEPKRIIENQLWWYGPTWLSQESSSWPQSRATYDTGNIPERRSSIALTTVIHDDSFIKDFSSLSRLIRIVAYCIRFASNCKKGHAERNVTPLSALELNNALNKCVRIVQDAAYHREITDILKNGYLGADSSLKNLNPFLDGNGYLRVGGRLTNASIPYDAKHQLILPPEHHLTKLLIESEHLRLLHAGSQLMMSSLRQRYWIPKIRQVIRKVIYSCLPCHKLRAATARQLMGSLPKERVTLTRPFVNVGIDYCGPILMKLGTKRSKQTSKAYIAVFVCLATKAVHLEVVTDLTTEAFVAALRRFSARRGCPSNIFSDNGTNFVGASRRLNELDKHFQSNETRKTLCNAASNMGITWHFIPPSGAHFGGLWEAAVKSLKHHLRRVMGTSILTFEELVTLITQIEACLNSRPLTKLSDDPNDTSYLTPSHFLIGQSLAALPDQDLSTARISSINRWQLLQKIQQDFWQKWSRDYLNTLQQRQKWKERHPNLRPGDIVFLKEENVPPLCWRKGIVEETHPGKDGFVRVVTVRTANGSFKRPVQRLSVLPVLK